MMMAFGFQCTVHVFAAEFLRGQQKTNKGKIIKVEEVNETTHEIGGHVFDPFGTSSTKKQKETRHNVLANLSDKNPEIMPRYWGERAIAACGKGDWN